MVSQLLYNVPSIVKNMGYVSNRDLYINIGTGAVVRCIGGMEGEGGSFPSG